MNSDFFGPYAAEFPYFDVRMTFAGNANNKELAREVMESVKGAIVCITGFIYGQQGLANDGKAENSGCR